jgi:DNA-binding helix-hairpin-helix protein with protein kinase domain
VSLFDQFGKAVLLGRVLGRGGEGVVYELSASASDVAKIYLQKPDATHASKLSWMVKGATPNLTRSCAWPTATLHESPGGPLVGMIMPRIPGHYRDIHHLYGLRSRVKEFPSATWKFMVHAAWNTAVAFDQVHEHGHLIGDVNERNVFVSPQDATVRLVDCDSFQVYAGGRVFECKVGVPTYTAPELQGTTFGRRTVVHDDFGLAVLIFQLLFVGRHPFAGRPRGTQELTLEDAIKGFFFAFSRKTIPGALAPPPHVPTLEIVPPGLAELFEAAFGPTGAARRPSASEWAQALSQLRADIRSCSVEPSHAFHAGTASCPWCDISEAARYQFDYFINTQAASTFVVSFAELDALSHRVHLLGQLDLGPTIASNPAGTSSVVPSSSWLARLIKPGIVGSIAGLLTSSLLSAWGIGAAAGASMSAIVLCLALCIVLVWRARLSPEGRELARTRKELSEAFGVYSRTLRSARDLISEYDGRAQEARGEIDSARRKYAGLKKEYEEEIARLVEGAERLQRRHYLEQFSIEDDEIDKIGRGRKANLRIHGVETAFDVLEGSWQVPGFGPVLRGALVAWAVGKSAGFRFDRQKGVPEGEKRLLVYRFRQQQVAIRERAGRKVEAAQSAKVNTGNRLDAVRPLLAAQSAVVRDLEDRRDEAAVGVEVGVWPAWSRRRFWLGAVLAWCVLAVWGIGARQPSARTAGDIGQGQSSTPAVVTVRVVGAPSDAVIRVDGKPQGAEFTLPRTDHPHDLEVSARGFRVFRQPLAGDRDATIQVELVPLRIAGANRGLRALRKSEAVSGERDRRAGRIEQRRAEVGDSTRSDGDEMGGEETAAAAADPEREREQDDQEEEREKELLERPSTRPPKKWADPFE